MKPYEIYIVGMMKYDTMEEIRLKIPAENSGEALKIALAATWKRGYDEYYIVEEDE